MPAKVSLIFSMLASKCCIDSAILASFCYERFWTALIYFMYDLNLDFGPAPSSSSSSELSSSSSLSWTYPFAACFGEALGDAFGAAWGAAFGAAA